MKSVLQAVSGVAALAAGGKKDEENGSAHADRNVSGAVSVKAQLDRAKIDRAEDYEGHMMVSVTGSDKGFKRTPICTVLVLDVSGSMCGPKIALLRETAKKIANNLTDKDEIAIVAFASHVETVLERTNAANKGAILAAIARLQATTCTNMSGGFLQGIKQVNEKFKGVKRVMLLTDGLANEGTTDREGLMGMAKGRDSSCTMSTFGFGTDCDQELLADMAKAGGGNYYFISGEDIKNIFARELGGMLSCIGQNLEVRIRPNKGGEVLEVLNDFTVADEDGEAVISAEDLFAGETKHILVKFKVAKPEGKPKARPFSVAHVTVAYDGVKSKKHEKHELNPKVTFVKEKDADAEPVLEVAEQVALIEAANAQLAAVEAAERGDFAGARSFLRGAQVMCAGLVDRGSHSARGLRHTMGASLKGFTADAYTGAYGSTVSNAALNATKYRKAAGDGEAFLSSNVAGTQSMDALEDDFTDDDPDIGDDVNVDPPDMGGGVNIDPAGMWTDGDGLPVTDFDINIPVNDAECIGGDFHDCPCSSCAARRTLEHVQNRPVPVIPGKPPIVTPGFPSPGQPNLPKKPKGEVIHEVDRDKSKFAKRSRRWGKK